MKRGAVLVLLFVLSLVLACGPSDSTPDASTDASADAPKVDATTDAGADVVVTPFDVSAAAATSATSVTVTFDAPPDPTEAVNLANYAIPGLFISGKPALTASTVTMTTSPQLAIPYTLTVSNVMTRASDAQPIAVTVAGFTGRAPFKITSAASVDSVTATVAFDAPPSTTSATTLANYSMAGLTLSGTPQLTGNVVTLTTSAQTGATYTVTASNVTRASDGEPLLISSATFTGTPTFNVSSAASTGNKKMTVTFDAPPDPTSAQMPANYAVPGLTVSAPSVSGNVVTLTTTAQTATPFTITVSNVTRASDTAQLAVNTANFTGRTSFNVTAAASVTATSMTVTFDAPPDATQAQTAANYAVSGLTLSSPMLSGNIVTLTTSAQTATTYLVTVSNVTRASDTDPLVTSAAGFTGRAPFDVSNASSGSAILLSVTFDAAPNVSQATTLANYSVAGLPLNGTPVLVGNTVTINTSAQSATGYTVKVTNVTRVSDSEPLLVNQFAFTGTAVQPPTVTNVVASTTAYNTGSTSVTITGTAFTSVACPGGIVLDDFDATKPTSCTVNSDTQITATFPAGIRTNASTGWNVLVTNIAGTNATSSVKYVPVAGLLISEVYTGTTGNTDHEFLELYNPTPSSIDTVALGIHIHIRNGTGTDTDKTLTAITTAVVPSHGFLLVVSSASASGDAWFTNRDYTYSFALVAQGGAYVSLSATAQAKVIDKVGWGTQPAGGFEDTAATNVVSNDSIERKPAGGAGHATDTDDNSSDFNAPSTTLTPRGTVDAPQP